MPETSLPPLLDVSKAQNQLLDRLSPLGTTWVSLEEAHGRVLAQDIVAGFDLPPFSNSAMDGFAVLVSDINEASPSHPVELVVVADVPAGQALDMTLSSGQAARIMTGAQIPLGAEAVVPVEDTNFNYRQPGIEAPRTVIIFQSVKSGENIRPAGLDLHAGQPVLSAGRFLRPQDLGFLSMLGVGSVEVRHKPRLAIFSSGDELLPVETALTPGKVHDANSYVLAALIENCKAEWVNLGIVPDDRRAVQACLDKAVSEKVDLILTSAGVSVGALDFVRSVVEEKGELEFWRVNMRPGKPLAFGYYKGVPFIGLPGNPVSAFVGFEVFVRPALLKLSGLTNLSRPVWPARLLDPIESDGRESYLRAIARWEGGELTVSLTGNQNSGNLLSLVQANALLIIPSGVKSLPSGAQVKTWLLDNN